MTESIHHRSTLLGLCVALCALSFGLLVTGQANA